MLRIINSPSSVKYKNEFNEIHRPYEDGPAIYYKTGTHEYRTNGLIHRPYKIGPAFIGYNGTAMWFEYGVRHRPVECGPAIIWYDNNKQVSNVEYYEHGKEILVPIEWYKKKLNAANVIQRNWKIAKYNLRYREFLTKVLTVPENHDSPVGKLFPNGGYDYKKFKESLLAF
jgi:hypothetical protein